MSLRGRAALRQVWDRGRLMGMVLFILLLGPVFELWESWLVVEFKHLGGELDGIW